MPPLAMNPPPGPSAADDLNKSAYLALAYKNASGFHVALKLPVDWAAANVGGDVNCESSGPRGCGASAKHSQG